MLSSRVLTSDENPCVADDGRFPSLIFAVTHGTLGTRYVGILIIVLATRFTPSRESSWGVIQAETMVMAAHQG